MVILSASASGEDPPSDQWVFRMSAILTSFSESCLHHLHRPRCAQAETGRTNIEMNQNAKILLSGIAGYPPSVSQHLLF
jgi:hypothetical protein